MDDFGTLGQSIALTYLMDILASKRQPMALSVTSIVSSPVSCASGFASLNKVQILNRVIRKLCSEIFISGWIPVLEIKQFPKVIIEWMLSICVAVAESS